MRGWGQVKLRELSNWMLYNNLEGLGWGERWEGGSRGRGHMCTYGWFMLIYSRNQYCKAIILFFKNSFYTYFSPSWTSLPHPFPSHPSGSSQCINPEDLVSCIKSGLVISFTYDNIHVSMLFSQIIPPLPSPKESKSLLYICVSFAVLHIGSSLPSF